MSEVKRYQKKPVVIEAMQFVSPFDIEVITTWCGGRFKRWTKPSDPSDTCVQIIIPTLEGNVAASAGDFIVRGSKGEFYPCKPDIFEATYEEVGGSGVEDEL